MSRQNNRVDAYGVKQAKKMGREYEKKTKKNDVQYTSYLAIQDKFWGVFVNT